MVFLSFMDDLKTFGILIAPFLSIFIPVLIAYLLAKKTNLVVGFTTIFLLYVLIFENIESIAESSPALATCLMTGFETYLSPIIEMVSNYTLFLAELFGLEDTILELYFKENGVLILFGIIWAVFLLLGILGNKIKFFKVITTIITTVLGLLLLVALFVSLDNGEAQAVFNLIHLF